MSRVTPAIVIEDDNEGAPSTQTLETRSRKPISPIYSVIEFIRTGGESRQPDRRCIRSVLKRLFKRYDARGVTLKNALLQTHHTGDVLNFMAEAHWNGKLRISSKKSFVMSCLAHFWVICVYYMQESRL